MAIGIVILLGSILIAILVGLDIFFAVDSVPGNTWSEIIRRWASITPVIPFICGVLSGHFFSWRDVAIMSSPSNIALLVWSACVVGIVGLGLYSSGNNIPAYLVFGLSFILGALLWPCA